MGSKLLWLGLTILTALPAVGFSGLNFVGGVLMLIGVILFLLDK